jgi:hypothetical protein
MRDIRVVFATVGLMLFLCNCGRKAESVPVDSSNLPECALIARQSGRDIVAQVTIANRTSSPFPLLSWNLPRDGRLTAPLFQIIRDGSPVVYTGIAIKRQVTADSYISIPPGKALSVDIRLLQGYDVKSPGQYSITYRAFNQRPDSSAVDALVSNTVNVVVH